jgi:DNA polymerase-4
VYRCLFHVDLDAFFVSVEQLHDPSLRNKPVIVGGHPNSRGVVSAASYEARRFGVHSAMPLSQAQRLCPQAVFVPLHFSRYVEASGRFMALLETVAPVVEPLGLDEAFLDMSDVAPSSEAARQRAVELKRRVRDELGLTVSVGVASCRAAAKVASDHDKPDGLVVIAPGGEAAFLAPLEVVKLSGVGEKTAALLRDLGVETIGQLAALPATVLQQKLGRYGEVLQLRAMGLDSSAVEPRGEPRSMSRETTFEVDTRDMNRLTTTLHGMCDELSRDLRTHGKRAGTVTLKLRYEDFHTVTRQASPGTVTNSVDALMATAAKLLAGLLAEERRLVRLIGVRASRLAGPEQQLDMFSPDAAKIQNLDNAIASIRRRHGPDAIHTLRSREK